MVPASDGETLDERPIDDLDDCDRHAGSDTVSWAMLLARISENRPLQCPRCGGPMRIIAFILEREAGAKM